MKFTKKVISGVLIVSLAFTAVTPAFAQTEVKAAEGSISNIMVMDVNEMDTSIPQELVGMDRFLSLDDQGCIQLDADAARAAGYAENLVTGVQGNLDNINAEVQAGNMYVDNTFTARTYQTEISPLDLEWTNGKGYSGIETTWYGDTFIYLNTSEAQCLYNAFDSISNQCGQLLVTLNSMSSDPDATQVHNYITSAVVIIGGTAVLIRSQVGNAKAAGKGIIWTIHQDFNTGAVGWGFGAQSW